MHRIIFVFSICFFVFSCNNSKPAASDNTVKTTPSETPQAQPAPIKTQGKALYPSVPIEIIQSLWEKSDYVDYSYDNLPFSMNRQQPNDIRHSLAQIAAQPALINDNCPPIGRALFYQNGSIALEARIYFSQGCNYFVFLENNQPKYANFMTTSGVAFFTDILSKFSEQSN